MGNLDRVIELSVQGVESRHNFKVIKELTSLPLKNPIGLSFVKETIPHSKQNELMMDVDPLVNLQ